jgi:hypothetical protein
MEGYGYFLARFGVKTPSSQIPAPAPGVTAT